MSATEFKTEFTNTLFTITDSSKETIEESIGRGDIIVVNSSTAGFDAINKDKMVFVLDSAAIPKTQDIMLDACEAEAATFCSSFSVFEAKFDDYLNSADLRHFYQEKRRLFVNDYVAYFGEDAAREIAEKMNLSPRTVDDYRQSLFNKLKVHSRVGLVMYAIKNGVVEI